MHAVGQIQAFLTSMRTGRTTEVLKQKNLIMYQAADVMAGLLAGDRSKTISHMYFQYENTNSTPTAIPTLTRASGRDDFDGISGVAPAQDWLRVPLVTTPRISRIPDNSEVFGGNAVMFAATSASSPSMSGESPAHNYFASSGVNGPSKITSVALVAAPTPSNNLNDLVFSRVNLQTPLTLPAGFYLTIYWLVKFN